MGILQKTIVALVDLGRGLRQNSVTKLIDAQISTDANNALDYGSDNGLFADGGQLPVYVETEPVSPDVGQAWLYETLPANGGAILGGLILQTGTPATYSVQIQTSGGIKTIGLS